MQTEKIWKIIAIFEILIASIFIILDVLIPTLIVLVLVVISLLIRHEKITSLGFKKPKSWLALIVVSILCAILLQLFDVGVLLPILNRLTGSTIDYSGFASLKGNLQQLLFILAVSWTLAALGEEIVYRGYFQKLLDSVFGKTVLGVALSIGISSVIFGLAHLEQGIIGVIACTFDAIIYSLLKRKFNNNLWASILAHGFYNSLGMIIFYFTGPIYALW